MLLWAETPQAKVILCFLFGKVCACVVCEKGKNPNTIYQKKVTTVILQISFKEHNKLTPSTIQSAVHAGQEITACRALLYTLTLIHVYVHMKSI